MRKPGNLLILAIVIGALGAALVYRQLSALRSEIDMARQAPESTVDVLVAAEPIPVGSTIQPQQVKVAAWPVNVKPEGALSDPQSAIGAVARVSIEKNQPLSQAQFLAEGAGLLPALIPEGMRAMSVKVDDVTGVSGFITPNSRVDVLVAGAAGDSSDSQEQHSKLVLQNIKVLAVGRSIEQRDDKPVEVPTVTLLVAPDQAEKLALAARYEPVRLALRNFGDAELVGTPGVSTATLFEARPKAAAPPAARPAEPAREKATAEPAARRPRHSVEVLLGEKVTRQDLF